MRQLILNRKVKFKTEYVDENGYLGTGFHFGEYYIKYLNDGQENSLSWLLLKRKRTDPLELNRTYDLGYVSKVKIEIGKDKIGRIKSLRYYKPSDDFYNDDDYDYPEEGWYPHFRYGIVKNGGISNTVTLSWDDGNKKIVFYNESDKKNTKLIIDKGNELIFKRDI